MFNLKRISAGFTLGAALTVIAQSALALGLGNVSVESYLNQPLRAKIDLIVREDDDLSSATASMASAEDYALIGANREAISVPLRFDLEEDNSGASILVTSRQAVRDPVIRLVIEVNWSSGRLLREYTLFLDPPAFRDAAPPPVVDERGKAPVGPPPESVEWVSSDDAERKETSSRPSGSGISGRSAAAGADYGPVQSGDTLWRIASDWSQGTGLNMNSVMLAIQRNNPQAFINGNVNLLKQGVILRMPRVDEVSAISAEAARVEVVQQNDAYSREVAATASETPLLDASSQPSRSSGAETSQAEPRDQLELVPPADETDIDSASGLEGSPADSQASTTVETLKEELARKEEELIVEQQQNEYLQEQITELKSQLQSAQGTQGGNVADAELGQLESQLREERLSKAQAPGAEQPPAAPAPAVQSGQAAVPTVITQEPEKPWYTSLTFWVLILLVLGVGTAGWFINRRSSVQTLELGVAGGRGEESVRGIKNEAEEILQVLKSEEATAPDETSEEPAGGEPVKTEAVSEPEPKPRTRASKTQPSEEAQLLDEDSADPEVRLDLARAYISMGDREAARVILDEVVETGSEEQQAEARKMLDGF